MKIDVTFLSFYLGNIPKGLSKSDSYLLKIFMAVSKKNYYQMLASEEFPHHQPLHKLGKLCTLNGENDFYSQTSESQR
ncbi:hypothetical protein LDENG_00000880 [Lucifuga dentata]|nr:hypothetical protein LDENG_00000880 [Lucifuga dentata]